jgi:tRNA modification GTPase
VVRLSGPEALAVAGRFFRPKSRRKRAYEDRRLVLGEIFDPEGGEVVDEAFLAYFKGPRSYTGEDVVELSCHGSPAVLEQTVALGRRFGARRAGPGEFTLRAYLNGRLDIIQAEAVNDLIMSVSAAQARPAVRQVMGIMSARFRRMKESLLRLAAGVEACLEFPDDGLRLSSAGHGRAIARNIREVESLISSYDTGRAVTEGVTLAMAGRKNVGKSTLFNALLEQDRALVSPYPGTTRDFLRERLVLNGFLFNLVDMAGLGGARHPVERLGIERGLSIAETADGLLFLLDASRELGREDIRLLKRLAGKKTILVLNKIDLPKRMDSAAAAGLMSGAPVVEVSALEGTNIEGLKQEILRSFGPRAAAGEDLILHARQRDILVEVRDALLKAAELLRAGHSEELCAEEVRRALELIGRLTGEIRADDVMRRVFSRFCVGK